MTTLMKNKFIYKSIVSILLLASILISCDTIAEEQTSVSYGELSKNFTTERRLTIAQENNVTVIVNQHGGTATGTTRAEMLKKTITPIEPSKATVLARSNSYSNYSDFAIYGATTLLQDDNDNDGFYQTFSVSFDADIISYTENQWDEVYALLYISKNGGPWTHYHTTDSFIITGESDLDEYEVITTFLSGYSTDYYDILIDLYQVGYSGVVTSYSSNDTNALYALSLESADYDEPYNEPYIEVVEITHGGSFSIVIILLFLLIYILRTKKCND